MMQSPPSIHRLLTLPFEPPRRDRGRRSVLLPFGRRRRLARGGEQRLGERELHTSVCDRSRCGDAPAAEPGRL